MPIARWASQIRQEPAESLETITASAIKTPHLHFSQISLRQDADHP